MGSVLAVSTSREVIDVAVWIASRDDSVLCVRPHGIKVFFLPGGLVESGETPRVAAVREVREEVGHVIVASELRDLGSVQAPAVGRPGVDVRLHCFAGSATPAALHAEPGEIAEIRWLGPQEATLIAPPVLKALYRFGGAAWASIELRAD